MEDVDASSGVVGVLGVFEILDLHEKLQELVEAFNDVDVDLQESLECLVTLSELVHSREVKWISPLDCVLLGQDLSVSGNDVACVLLK